MLLRHLIESVLISTGLGSNGMWKIGASHVSYGQHVNALLGSHPFQRGVLDEADDYSDDDGTELPELHAVPGVRDGTDAPREQQIAPQDLSMVQAEEGPTEVEAPVNPRRTTRPHTRHQRLGQNIYDT